MDDSKLLCQTRIVLEGTINKDRPKGWFDHYRVNQITRKRPLGLGIYIRRWVEDRMRETTDGQYVRITVERFTEDTSKIGDQ